MKRTAASLLAAALLATGAAGAVTTTQAAVVAVAGVAATAASTRRPARSTPSSRPTVPWRSPSGTRWAAPLEETINAVTDAYNTSQDLVHVNLVNQQSYENNFESYRTATPEDRPSLVQLPEYYLQAMADSGTAIPIEACAEASSFDLEPLLDRAVEYYTLEGVLQTMPFNVSGPVLYYNRLMFQQAV